MDIINHYDVITYNVYDEDKYTGHIYFDKCTVYYMNRKIHRDNDLPAIIYPDGTQRWYVNGQLHRDNDKPAIIFANGSGIWYINNERIRCGLITSG